MSGEKHVRENPEYQVVVVVGCAKDIRAIQDYNNRLQQILGEGPIAKEHQ